MACCAFKSFYVNNLFMRTLLLGTGYHHELEPLVSYRPSLLLHVADKPVIFHVIESVIQLDCKEIHILLNHYPEQIEKRVGTGERWGINIYFHLIKDPNAPFSMIKVISRQWDDNLVLIGQGDRLPGLPNLQQTEIKMFYNDEAWSGWGTLSADQLRSLPTDKSFHEIPNLIGGYAKEAVDTLIDCSNLQGLFEANRNQLNKEEPDLLFPTSAYQVEPGIWISRGAVLEPGAIILPPVFLGADCHISSGATVGPNSIIERSTLVGTRSRVENSLICQHSYIGENLEINSCIVDRNSLANLKHGIVLDIHEQFILSDTTIPPIGHYLFEILERGTALLLLALLFPIYFWLKKSCGTKRFEAVILPASNKKEIWKTMPLTSFIPQTPLQKFFKRLPYLWEIALGNLHFIGVSPRSPEQIEEMPLDWKQMYLQSKSGLITLAQLDYGQQADLDEQYASEAFYAAHMSLYFDCKLFLRWLLKKAGLSN